MNLAATIALAAAALAVHVAVLSRRMSLAPGWHDQRWFSLAALTVAVFTALDISATIGVPAPVVIWCSRGQIVMAGIHVFAWIRYSDEHLGGAAPGRLRALLDRVPLAVGFSALIPGVVFHDAVRFHVFAPLGVTYQDVVPTLFGEGVLALLLGFFLVLALRYALAWRRGVPHAAVTLSSLAFLTTMVANDALVASGVLQTPYLIDIGFIVPIGAVAYSLTARFTNDARDLAHLRERLERLVEDRTAALAVVRERLHRSEKLAALGQLAAGVAHEVNNPAAALAANLGYLLESHQRDGGWPEDAAECLAESMVSTERITHIVRQLLDAGRLAAVPVKSEPVRLAPLARESVRTSIARCGDRVRLAVDVDEGLTVLAHESMLVQVLVNLIVNGVQAVPDARRDGLVTIRGERTPGQVRLVVEDNGVGMDPGVMQRVFEPFFTTKPFGSGTGLGLAVSRGLVHSLGGDLRFESASGGGTRAVVELPEAPESAGEQAM